MEFKKGWKNPGYHYLIDKSGVISQLLDDSGVSNGVKGYNSTSIQRGIYRIFYDTGKGVDNRTEEQKKSLRAF